MKGERHIQSATVLLLVATIVISFVSASASESHVQRYVNGQSVSQADLEHAQAAAMSALTGQPMASDRSLILTKTVAKGLALKKLKKKKKKNPLKSPLKGLPPLLPLLGLGAAAASAAGAGAGAAATGAGAVRGVQPTFLASAPYAAALPDNLEIPIWKVHKYNGIDIRPVRLSDLPLPPPSESEGFHVIGNAPKEVFVPEPVAPFPTPIDPITFPEPPTEVQTTYGVPAQTYGPPAQTYGPPAQTYGPPAQTYGPPAQTYGPPAPTYGVPVGPYPPPTSGVVSTGPIPTDEGATAEGLEALSNLGALTDLLPGGGDASSGIFGGQNRGIAPLSIFNRLNPFRGAPSLPELPLPVTAVFRQPPQSAIQNLLGRIPIISSLTNFGSSNPSTHVNIPPLPELPAVPDIANIRGASPIGIPQIPHIRLPTKYILKGEPYVSIRYPAQPTIVEPVPVPAPEPVPVPVVEPVIEPVKPEVSAPLPLEPVQPQPQYGAVTSYGTPVQTGYYVTPVVAQAAPQFTVPVYSGPVPAATYGVPAATYGVPAATYGVPANTYGLPGGDSFVAASEIDTATSTDCADGKSCAKSVLKVAVPEGETRAVTSARSAVASPVFKKEEAAPAKEVSMDNMARYLDPEHPSAATTKTVAPVADAVDAKPSTATEDEE